MRSYKEMMAERAAYEKAHPNEKKSDMRGFGLVMAVSIITAVTVVFGPRYCESKRDQELRHFGRRAEATIMSIEETGNLYNRNPEVVIVLHVRPLEAAPFEVEVTKVLSLTEIAKYVEGAVVDVRYDPTDTDAVALVGLARKPDTEVPK